MAKTGPYGIDPAEAAAAMREAIKTGGGSDREAASEARKVYNSFRDRGGRTAAEMKLARRRAAGN